MKIWPCVYRSQGSIATLHNNTFELEWHWQRGRRDQHACVYTAAMDSKSQSTKSSQSMQVERVVVYVHVYSSAHLSIEQEPSCLIDALPFRDP